MNVHTIEGRTYILQSEVEETIRSMKSDAAKQRKALQADIDGLQANLTAAEGQVTAAVQQLAELEETRTALSLARAGITDPDLADAVLWQHGRAHRGVSEDQIPTVDQWVKGLASDPSSAPLVLRPHLAQLGALSDKTGDGAGDGSAGDTAADAGNDGAGGGSGGIVDVSGNQQPAPAPAGSPDWSSVFDATSQADLDAFEAALQSG